MKKNNTSIKGFTLAEVLITLVIIGIIAALTVPALINKNNNKQAVARLKKTYSALAQATNQIIAEEGTPKASVGGWASSPDAVYQQYKKHLINLKECGTSQGCFGNGVYKLLNNTNDAEFDNYNAAPKFIMADGTQVMIYNTFFSATCGAQYYGMVSNVCINFYVDINGKQKPNKYGRDMFVFVLKENGLYPVGCDGVDKCSTSDLGNGCACKILKEGEMNY